MKSNHPAIFPKKLVEKCIKVTGIKKGLILDPFVGTGTTCIVADQMGFESIGIDINSDYIAFALKKLQEKVDD